MEIDVIVGCQYGSEGKGLAASKVAADCNYDWLVSVNTAQAGHTAPAFDNGEVVGMPVLRQLPAAAVNNHKARIYVGAGAIINIKVLCDEIKMLGNLGIPVLGRLVISGQAGIVTEDDEHAERQMKLFDKLGSTMEGIGESVVRRVRREAQIFRDVYSEMLAMNGWTVADVICDEDDYPKCMDNCKIFLEGSQGYGLSLYSSNYPKCTSRDTTVAAFLSAARLSPKRLNKVYGVYRTFPIRVAGNSGFLYGEKTWPEITEISGYEKLEEITTVTKRIRRIGMWDGSLAKRATVVNGVTHPILTFANYFDSSIENQNDWLNVPLDIRTKIVEMAKDTTGYWAMISTSKIGGWITNNYVQGA